MQNRLLALTEQALGSVTFPAEYRAAKRSAQRKRRQIIERFGDEGGERRKPYYLALLTAEIIKAERLTRTTDIMCEIIRDKKRAAAPEGNSNSITHIPIVAQI